MNCEFQLLFTIDYLYKDRYILIPSLKMIFSSNEIYFCTSGDTKKYSLPVDKAYKSITTSQLYVTNILILSYPRVVLKERLIHPSMLLTL